MCSMSQVEVPGPNVPILLSSQQEVEQHLSEALVLRFQLTANFPFLTDPLHYELGLLGTSPASQAILQDTSQCPASVDPYTQQLISILWIPQQSSPVASGISQDDFINHWKCCKERTSSLNSRLHYRHYKASVDCPCIAEFPCSHHPKCSLTKVTPSLIGNPAFKFYSRKSPVPFELPTLGLGSS